MNKAIFTPSRRALLAGASALGLVGIVSGCSTPAQAASSGMRLWYQKPAARWEEALPLGNGRLGAMVFGRVGQERLQLNEDTLWAGSPYTPDNPEALDALPEVRRLINERKYKEAADLAAAKMMGKPASQMSYGTLGDLLLTFEDAQTPASYERELDLETAVTSVRYATEAGEYHREAFASAPDQVVVWHTQAKSGAIGFDLGYRGPKERRYTPADYSGVATDPNDIKPVDWTFREEEIALPEHVRIVAQGKDEWLITGRNEPQAGIPSGLTYALRVKVITDGKVTVTDNAFSVRDAKSVTLLSTAATSFVSFEDVSGDPVTKTREVLGRAARKSYADLKKAHVKDYQALFNTMSLDLGRTSLADLPTDERILAAETSDDPALAALYFQYGRYMLISSSRPGTQPANLQGIWNEATNPPWNSKYTININAQMNYWPAAPAGLGMCAEPLVGMVEGLAIKGAATAKTMYGARGWVTHHNTDIWRVSAPIDGPFWGLWPCGGAWLCVALWDQYDYSRDPELLKRIYPLLKGSSLFFLDTLVEDVNGRGLVTSPSVSPENAHPFGTSVCAGPAMDQQIIRDLFDATMAAGEALKQDADLMAEIAATRARLATDQIGKSGQFQEWLEDWDADAPEQGHRHVSHLYAVYPSSQKNVRDTPEFTEAAKVTLNQRGDLTTGWGTAWRLCLWARMGEGDHSLEVLKALMGPKRTYPNMFDAHPPFQIDGNFGGAAGIMEMVVQSWGGEIHLLPALPSAWVSGTVRGLRARGNISVDMTWANGKVASLTLKGPANAKVNLRENGQSRQVTLDGRGAYRFNA